MDKRRLYGLLLANKIEIDKIHHGVPVILFLKGGKVLSTSDIQFKKTFSTKYFIIMKSDTDSNCVTLMLLKKCKVCCDKFVLVPTYRYIMLDISCICGYQFLRDVCIRKCNHQPIQFDDCFCGSFSMISGYDEIVLWKSNTMDDQYGRILFEIENGDEGSLEVRKYYKYTNSYKSYPFFDRQVYDLELTNCSAITIFKSDKDMKVNGQYEIQLTSEIDYN
jgi:hypothetical protein